jgi:hypothetical protein
MHQVICAGSGLSVAVPHAKIRSPMPETIGINAILFAGILESIRMAASVCFY